MAQDQRSHFGEGFRYPWNGHIFEYSDRLLGWNLSALYHLTPQVETLVEFDGEHVFGGKEDDVDVVNVTPGFKFEPFDEPNLLVGVGVSLPLTDDKAFHAMSILSVFYHF